MAVFQFMVVDQDGRRVGRSETSQPDWWAGDVFDLVACNAVWSGTRALVADR